MERKPVIIYDTTLRDGTQGSGVSFSVDDKLKIAQRLDELRFDYVEGGYPGSNPRDAEFFKRARDIPFHYAKIAAFGSTRRANIKSRDDTNLRYLIEADTPVVTIFGKSSVLQVKDALRTTLEENLRMISDSVAYLKNRGKEVVYDAEHFFDGFRGDREYALKTLHAAKMAGADFIVLCDTNGGTPFYQLSEIVRDVRKILPQSRLGIHAHNDKGYGVANSIASVLEGVEMVQGTVNGFGERTGNANLNTILGNLFMEKIPTKGNIDVSNLTPFSRLVYELANLPPDPSQPYVGDSAFAHKGGMHVAAVLNNPILYEHVDPKLFGNRRDFLDSDLAGTAHLERYGLSKKDPLAREILQEIKRRENDGYSYETARASLELLIRQMRGEKIKLFDLIERRVNDLENRVSGHNEIFASIKIRVNGSEVVKLEYGNGPVNALDTALRAALESKYPELKNLKLIDFRVREIPEEKGTASRVRVWIESQLADRTYGTVGVGANSTKAAFEALVDSYNYAHLLMQSK